MFSDEELELQLRLPAVSCGSAASSPRLARRDSSSIRKGGSGRTRRDPPAVTFIVENDDDDDDGQITFSTSSRPLPPRSRPSSLLVTYDDVPGDGPISGRSKSVEDSSGTDSPIFELKLKGLKRTTDILKKVSSADKLSRLKELLSRGGSGSRERSPARDDVSDDESVPLVSPPAGSSPGATSVHSKNSGSPSKKSRTHLGVECRDDSLQDVTVSTDFSPRSDATTLESPRDSVAFDLLPERKCVSNDKGTTIVEIERAVSEHSISNMMEPYNMRLLSRGASETRYLWRQDALDAPPWPWDEPDSAV